MGSNAGDVAEEEDHGGGSDEGDRAGGDHGGGGGDGGCVYQSTKCDHSEGGWFNKAKQLLAGIVNEQSAVFAKLRGLEEGQTASFDYVRGHWVKQFYLGKTLAGKNRVKFNDFGDGWHGDWRGTFLGTIT